MTSALPAISPGDKTVRVALSPSTIVTARLTLVPLVPQDADEMFEVLADERMHEFTGGSPRTLDELRSRYQRLAIGRSTDRTELWFNWVVRINETQHAVGAMQATVAADGSTADVAWEIGAPFQGRGFASEAATAIVRWLTDQDVTVIRALVHPEHVASARVAAHAGLEQTLDEVDGEIVWRRGGG
jgi:RimJ/RimL family protein N-acetyltransferase